MFKHVLLFKFIDPEVCAPVVGQKLLALKETVPEIVEIEYGLDELHKGRRGRGIWPTTWLPPTTRRESISTST